MMPHATLSTGAEKDMLFIQTVGDKKDVLSFRQHDSFTYAQKYYANFSTVVESPDIAFMLGPQVEVSTGRACLIEYLSRDTIEFDSVDSNNNHSTSSITSMTTAKWTCFY